MFAALVDEFHQSFFSSSWGLCGVVDSGGAVMSVPERLEHFLCGPAGWWHLGSFPVSTDTLYPFFCPIASFDLVLFLRHSWAFSSSSGVGLSVSRVGGGRIWW